jgi:hypothetical protein
MGSIRKLEDAFSREFNKALDEGRRLFRFRPARIKQMIAKHGAVVAARKILEKGVNPQKGLIELHSRRRPDLSVEAKVLLPKYKALFAVELRNVARQRLQSCRDKNPIKRHMKKPKSVPRS